MRRLNRGEVAAIDRPAEIAAKLDLLYDRFRSGTLERSYALGEVRELSRRAEAERLHALLLDLARNRCR